MNGDVVPRLVEILWLVALSLYIVLKRNSFRRGNNPTGLEGRVAALEANFQAQQKELDRLQKWLGELQELLGELRVTLERVKALSGRKQ